MKKLHIIDLKSALEMPHLRGQKASEDMFKLSPLWLAGELSG